MWIVLKFTFPDKYPEEAPDIEFEQEDNVGDQHLEELKQHLSGSECISHIIVDFYLFLKTQVLAIEK